MVFLGRRSHFIPHPNNENSKRTFQQALQESADSPFTDSTRGQTVSRVDITWGQTVSCIYCPSHLIIDTTHWYDLDHVVSLKGLVSKIMIMLGISFTQYVHVQNPKVTDRSNQMSTMFRCFQATIL